MLRKVRATKSQGMTRLFETLIRGGVSLPPRSPAVGFYAFGAPVFGRAPLKAPVEG